MGPVETYPEDKWDAIMDVCLNSTFHTSKAALPYMLQAGWGRIINTVGRGACWESVTDEANGAGAS